MIKLSFTKMQGLGNDFIVLDATCTPISLSPELIRRLGDRHFGIGFDQLLIVEPAQDPANDFRYRIFNNDGLEVEQCGNGARCFARFVHERGLSSRHELRVETARGLIMPRLTDDGLVTVEMGQPRFAPADIPFLAPEEAGLYPLEYAGLMHDFSVLSMGNPHAVCVVPSVEEAPVVQWGAALECHPRFPERVNVGFMQIVNPESIRLRVFERAAGETLACGSGACAAVVAGIRRGLLNDTVRVHTRGGHLMVRWQGVGEPVWLTGPALTVFTGEIELAL